MQEERFTNLPFRLRREWAAFIVTTDGLVDLGTDHGCQRKAELLTGNRY